MSDKVFEEYGITLFKRAGKFSVLYDAGHFVVQMREDEVTEEQALRLQQGNNLHMRFFWNSSAHSTIVLLNLLPRSP
jgi:hypothetical protein